MQYQCFSKTLFAAWLAYAVYHAYIVYNVVFMALTMNNSWSTAVQNDGQMFGHWLSGNTVYGSCIFISNLILIHRSFLIHPLGILIIFGMVSAFFVIFNLMSHQKPVTIFPDISGVYEHNLGQPLVWLTIFIALVQMSIGELLWRAIKF